MAVRARDLRDNIHTHGFEKGVVATLEVALEELGQLRQHMRELTQLVSHCIDQVDRMVIVGGAMTNQLQQIKREQKGDDDGEAS